MLTFNITLGYQDLRDFLWILFYVFFFNPTDQPISGNAFDAKWKKRGMASLKVVGILYSWPLFLVFFFFLVHVVNSFVNSEICLHKNFKNKRNVV